MKAGDTFPIRIVAVQHPGCLGCLFDQGRCPADISCYDDEGRSVIWLLEEDK